MSFSFYFLSKIHILQLIKRTKQIKPIKPCSYALPQM